MVLRQLNYEHEFKATAEERVDITVASLAEKYLEDIKIHNGVPITTISKRLGHKSPKITLDVYSHMYEESGEQVANMLQNVFFVLLERVGKVILVEF